MLPIDEEGEIGPMALSFSDNKRIHGLQLVFIFCVSLCFLSLLCPNILLSIYTHLSNMYIYFLIIMAIALLPALVVTTWLANIRGISTVTAGRVAQDGLVLWLGFAIWGITTVAFATSVSREAISSAQIRPIFPDRS